VTAGGAPTTPDHNLDDVRARSGGAAIPALSETPGFQSLGGLMAVRYHGTGYAGLGAFDALAAAYPTNIDFMGHQPEAMGQSTFWGSRVRDHSRVGVDSVLLGSALPTRANGYPVNVVRTDGMEGEYKEKLAIANAVVNTVSIRSDYFIAWFVVHGYQKSDVENLGPTDVMTPTIARRFVMVVDRSNVVKTGDKPNILLYKEVPYKGR